MCQWPAGSTVRRRPVLERLVQAASAAPNRRRCSPMLTAIRCSRRCVKPSCPNRPSPRPVRSRSSRRWTRITGRRLALDADGQQGRSTMEWAPEGRREGQLALSPPRLPGWTDGASPYRKNTPHPVGADVIRSYESVQPARRKRRNLLGSVSLDAFTTEVCRSGRAGAGTGLLAGGGRLMPTAGEVAFRAWVRVCLRDGIGAGGCSP